MNATPPRRLAALLPVLALLLAGAGCVVDYMIYPECRDDVCPSSATEDGSTGGTDASTGGSGSMSGSGTSEAEGSATDDGTTGTTSEGTDSTTTEGPETDTGEIDDP